MYDSEFLIKEAIENGFSQACVLNNKALVFMPEVRQMCSANRCKQYNTNWSCPPGCGTIEDSAKKAAKYSFGILVQTIGQLEDEFDFETMGETSEKHKKNFAALVEKLKQRYDDVLPMGAGPCDICKKCTYPDAPCRFPDKAITAMEAYGLFVSKVCEMSGIPYNNGKNTVTYTSVYLLK